MSNGSELLIRLPDSADPAGPAASISAAMPFGIDRYEPPFPFATILVLLIILAAAVIFQWVKTGGISLGGTQVSLLGRSRRLLPWSLIGPKRQLCVLERQALASGTQLVVVQYGLRQLLLCVSAQQTQCLRDDACADLEALEKSLPQTLPLPADTDSHK